MVSICRILTIPQQMFRFYRMSLANRFMQHSARELSTSADSQTPFLMVASIGNPEPEYSGTRHSVGHFVLDTLVDEHWKNFQPFKKHKGLPLGKYSVSKDDTLKNMLLFKSDETYMNLQGAPVIKNWRQIKSVKQHQFDPALVVIYDDISVPLGKIQVRRPGTSARGHNGLRSIDKLAGQTYTKIAVGIGKPPNKYVDTYVLSKFKAPEMETLRFDSMPQIVDVLNEMYKGKYIYDKV